MILRPPRSSQGRSSAASDVYKRQAAGGGVGEAPGCGIRRSGGADRDRRGRGRGPVSYTHLRDHETHEQLVCRRLLEKKKKNTKTEKKVKTVRKKQTSRGGSETHTSAGVTRQQIDVTRIVQD